MRFALIALALLAGGCAWNPGAGYGASRSYVVGVASYTMTPAVVGSSGALSLNAVACIAPRSSRTPRAGIQLGTHCALSGEWFGARYGPTSVQLTSADRCALPGATGPIPVRMQTATLAFLGGTVDVAAGGVTSDGSYIAYRFTGAVESGADPHACDEVLRGSLPPPAAPSPPPEPPRPDPGPQTREDVGGF